MVARQMKRRTADPEILSKVLDGIPVPLFVIDRQHNVSHWNGAMEALTGIKKGDIIGTNNQWKAFYPPKSSTPADLIVDVASGGTVDFQTEEKYAKSLPLRGFYKIQEFYPGLGESGRWARITASPIRDSEGMIIGAIETVEDITEYKNIQFTLEQSEKSYRDVFEKAVDAMWVQDLYGNVILVNKTCERLTGYSRDELMAKNVKELLIGEWLEVARDVRRKLLAGEEFIQPYEQHLVRKDGTVGTLTMSTILMTVDGKPAGFQHMARDMTDEVRMRESIRFYLQKVLVAQEEERKRIARELHDDTAQLLLSLSRQVDNFIRSRNKLTEDEVIFLRDLQTKLNNGVTEVHRFSQALRLSVLDDLGLIPAIRSLLKALQDTDGIKTSLTVRGKERRYPAEVETMLFRIVQEATNNIRRHAKSPDTNVTIDFRDDRIIVTIKDSGMGFKISGTLNDFLRSGKLGLAGIQERARLLGGTIDVNSVPGKGTTLTVTVPNSVTGL
jgi:PAS domain S-box-containing protein